MEEQEEINQNNNQIENKKIKIRASEIIKRFKSIKDREAFCIENSKKNFYYIRFIFPSRIWVRFNLFFTFFKRRQKGNIILIIFHSYYQLACQAIII